MNKIIINAVNINNGGGEILLNQLIKALPNENVIIFCSKKLNLISNKEGIKFIRIKSNLFSRFLSEIRIFFKSQENDKVLYFGNLPPIFKINSFVYLFTQDNSFRLFYLLWMIN